jgi:hypothetical protein
MTLFLVEQMQHAINSYAAIYNVLSLLVCEEAMPLQ